MTYPFLTGEKPPAEKFGQSATPYTPVLTASTNPNLGNDSVARGTWMLVGDDLVIAWARFVWGGSGLTAGSGTYNISLPTQFPADLGALDASTTPGYGFQLGAAYVRDHSAGGNNQIVIPQIDSATTYRLIRHNVSTAVSHSNTISWATDDTISAWVLYPRDKS